MIFYFFQKKVLTEIFLYDIMSPPCKKNNGISRCGGIGRRHGLKIRWEEIPVPVQVRSSAPNIAGWSSSVARRAHNPKVVWFKSRPRNQRKPVCQKAFGLFSFLCAFLKLVVLSFICPLLLDFLSFVRAIGFHKSAQCFNDF